MKSYNHELTHNGEMLSIKFDNIPCLEKTLKISELFDKKSIIPNLLWYRIDISNLVIDRLILDNNIWTSYKFKNVNIKRLYIKDNIQVSNIKGIENVYSTHIDKEKIKPITNELSRRYMNSLNI